MAAAISAYEAATEYTQCLATLVYAPFTHSPSSVVCQPAYVNERGRSRPAVGALGLVAVRAELHALEIAMAPGLHRVDVNWSGAGKGRGTSKVPRAQWLKACREAMTVGELAKLLMQLESMIYQLQEGADLVELRLWRQENEWVGMSARRFFPAWEADADGRRPIVPVDGKITGWLPADGEDCALWHMVMDDNDEEELDEGELREAVEAFASGRTTPPDHTTANLLGGVTDEHPEPGPNANANLLSGVVDEHPKPNPNPNANLLDDIEDEQSDGVDDEEESEEEGVDEQKEEGEEEEVVVVAGREEDGVGGSPRWSRVSLRLAGTSHTLASDSSLPIATCAGTAASGQVKSKQVKASRIKPRAHTCTGSAASSIEAVQAAEAATIADVAMGAGTTTVERTASHRPLSDDGSRLWSTAEGRERWLKALGSCRTSAALSVAIHALQAHCTVFGVLADRQRCKATIAHLDQYYHAAAFITPGVAQGAKRRRTSRK